MSMKRIFVPGTPADKMSACVAAIGVFDGVHRGHQKVIRRAVAEARRLKVPSVVVTFHPHPAAVLHSRRFVPYIMTLEHRLRLIEALGVDAAVVIRFGRRFASAVPEKFVHDLLLGRLGVKKVVVGHDFHFGREGRGTVVSLRNMGKKNGFDVEEIKILKNINRNIKSSFIRKLVLDGDLALLKRFLGRPHAVFGAIESGDGRGRRLGYPTANLKKENVVILPSGIYFIHAHLPGKKKRIYPGLCYIGRRPTFKRLNARVIQEVHLLDRQRDLYGRRILVEFISKLRDDRRFSDEKDLVAQIARDVRKARSFARRHPVAPSGCASPFFFSAGR